VVRWKREPNVLKWIKWKQNFESILTQKQKISVQKERNRDSITRLESGIEAEFKHALKIKLFDKTRQVLDEEIQNISDFVKKDPFFPYYWSGRSSNTSVEIAYKRINNIPDDVDIYLQHLFI
jgi:hypothetical protein